MPLLTPRASSAPICYLSQVLISVSLSPYFVLRAPSGIEDYLNNYKLGGDLLQALHMTCEDGTFLFRTRFETTEKSDNDACVEEDAALSTPR